MLSMQLPDMLYESQAYVFLRTVSIEACEEDSGTQSGVDGDDLLF